MTLAVDKVSSYDQALAGYTWTFTPNVSVPQGILVYVVTYDGNAVDTISGVTYGGLGLTKIASTIVATPAVSSPGFGSVWYLPLNLLSGAQLVHVTTSQIPTANSVSVMVVSYTTATADTPIAVEAVRTLGGTGTDSWVSNTINTSVDTHITAMAIEPNLGSPSNTSPHAPLVDVLEDDWGISMSNYGQVPGISPPGVYVIGWDYTSTTVWAFRSVAIKEGVPLPPTGPELSPTDMGRKPEAVQVQHDGSEWQLYDLVGRVAVLDGGSP